MRHGTFRLCQCWRTALRHRWSPSKSFFIRLQSTDAANSCEEKPIHQDLGRLITDDFAAFKEKYQTPDNPIVLAHGLMGFDELHLVGHHLPGVQYWRGIKQALNANDIEVITTTVPTTGSIETRGKALAASIAAKAAGKHVNIIAHSMGGLDSRFLISQIKPSEFKVLSLTTIATPHRGSSAADIIFREIGETHVPGLYKLLARLNIDSGAFGQLTRKYMREEFNPANPDDPAVRYFSYGASATPALFSAFRLSHSLMDVLEGPNDGLVSVASSRWGKYQGTLMGVTHLDLINWTNRLKLLFSQLTMQKRSFQATAFYLHICDMLSKEGL